MKKSRAVISSSRFPCSRQQRAMSKRRLCVLLFTWLVLPQLSAKTYDRCQLARELLFKYRLPADQISQCNIFSLSLFPPSPLNLTIKTN